MNKFMSITRKMQLLMLLGILAALASLMMVQGAVERLIVTTHAERAKAITATALGIVSHYQQAESMGQLSRDQAQDQARSALKAMRYGRDGEDYVYVMDEGGYMVIHPVRPDWDGRDVRGVRDVNGVVLFNLLRDSALGGASHFSYQMSRGRELPSQAKIAHARYFQPWGWFIATGSFDDEISNSYWRLVSTFLWTTAPVLLVLVCAVVWVSWWVARPVRQLAGFTDLLRRKFYDAPVPGVERHDEIGLLARALADLRVSARDAEHLRHQRDLAAKVFDTSQEGIVITDADGVILTVNPSFERISGFAADQVIGAKPSLWQSKQHDAAFYANMWSTLARDGRWDGEITNRRRDGSITVVQQTIYRVRDENGVAVNHVAIQRDVTEARRQQDRIEFLAYHDPLTDLPNRTLLMDRLGHAVTRAKRRDGKVAVLFLDLDRFKAINDTMGHDVGDKVLQQVAERLRQAVRDSDTVARMGGDEFVVLMEQLNDNDAVIQTIERILATLSRPSIVAGSAVHSPPSVGVAVYPDDGDTPVALLKGADAAMYAAKAAGGNTYSFFNAELTEKLATGLRLEAELRQALAQGHLRVYFQPKLCMRTGSTLGAEALVRWAHPQKGLIPPADFIPLAEKIGLIGEIGQWMLTEVCRQMAEWPAALADHLKIAVNVSVQQLNGDFVPYVAELVAGHGLAPSRLELEVTESSVMGSPERVIATLSALRNLGFSIAVDDFGTGYSSLSYLKRLPIDVLKIDRAFVMNVVDDPTDGEIVGTIIALAKALKLSTVAEGVETEEQWRFLRRAGCVASQGFLHGRPMPGQDFLDWLALRAEVDQPWGDMDETPRPVRSLGDRTVKR